MHQATTSRQITIIFLPCSPSLRVCFRRCTVTLPIRISITTNTARKMLSPQLLASQQQNYPIRYYTMQKEQQTTKDALQGLYDYQDSDLLKIEIKPSELPQSGMGLFATKPINNSQLITEYYGSIMHTKNCMDKQFTHEDKMVQIDGQYCVISRSACSRANDVVKWEPQLYDSPFYQLMRKRNKLPKHEGKIHNAKLLISPKQKAFLSATRKIQPGQEIHIDYGFQYWDFFLKLKINEEKGL